MKAAARALEPPLLVSDIRGGRLLAFDFFVGLQDRHKGFLRNFDLADGLHPLLAPFLLV